MCVLCEHEDWTVCVQHPGACVGCGFCTLLWGVGTASACWGMKQRLSRAEHNMCACVLWGQQSSCRCMQVVEAEKQQAASIADAAKAAVEARLKAALAEAAEAAGGLQTKVAG